MVRYHALPNEVYRQAANEIVEEINKLDIREISEGNYRIIYRTVDETTVHILMVHHGARDLTRRFKNEK